jgi:DNA polymerase lambda
MEIIKTGKLRRVDYENTPEVQATSIFMGIYGVGKGESFSPFISSDYLPAGKETAFQWYKTGLRTLDDIRARKGGLVLSKAQEIGLRFYDGLSPGNINLPQLLC